MTFSFAQPLLLLLLLLLPVVGWGIVVRRRRRPGLRFPATERAAAASRFGGGSALFWLVAMRLCALAMMIVALAGPRFGSEVRQIDQNGIDIMLCVDISGSMLAIDMDWQGRRSTRIEVVKSVIDDFIQQRPADRIGMIAFASDPYLVSPLTLEHAWLRKNIARLEVGMIESGTSIGPPLGTALNRLREIPESAGRIVILLTDGNDSVTPEVPPVRFAEAAAALGVKVYTIAIGKGGIVPSYVLGRDGQIARDMLGRPRIERLNFPLDEAVLREMAAKGGGRFFRARDVEQLREIYGEIDRLEKREVKLEVHTEYEDAWMLPLCCGVLLLLLEQLLASTWLRTLP
jgi:Ca-activated chloride channel family protein